MSEVVLEKFPCCLIVDRFLECLPRLMIKESHKFNSLLFGPKNQKGREKKNFNLINLIAGEAQQESGTGGLFRLTFRSSLA